MYTLVVTMNWNRFRKIFRIRFCIFYNRSELSHCNTLIGRNSILGTRMLTYFGTFRQCTSTQMMIQLLHSKSNMSTPIYFYKPGLLLPFNVCTLQNIWGADTFKIQNFDLRCFLNLLERLYGFFTWNTCCSTETDTNIITYDFMVTELVCHLQFMFTIHV